MDSVFTPIDWIIFFAAIVGAMAVGLYAGRKEESAEDYFLAGRQIPWWGVAGSIFGSNVSANHMVGMMGIGFSVGFAQSHFELGAIAGLMLLCYGFLPVYRKLRIYTLSEYLGRRYDERSRLLYAVIMIVIMVLVQMVPALYIGARSICVLIGGDAVSESTKEEPTVADHFAAQAGDTEKAKPVATVTKSKVNLSHYSVFVIALALISASYTILGGLKAVVWTDVIQSMLLLIVGLLVAFLVFRELGGWNAMMSIDGAAEGGRKMRLYLPSNHPVLPWTGVFTGLMFLHFFYWGTNQFIVQRALAARSDTEARIGIVAAGFLKMIIPFFSIAAGIAAYYLFQRQGRAETIAPDTAFTEAVKLVVPIGYGIVGLIAAGLIGAILSSIDSMMNSAATIVTLDIYKRHINPRADDKRMILIGRISIVGFVVLAAIMAIFVLDPNSEENFFMVIVDYSNYLAPGLFVVFFVGMFSRRATATGAVVTIVTAIVFSGVVQYGYDNFLGMNPQVYTMVNNTQELDKTLDEAKLNNLPDEMKTMARAEMLDYLEAEQANLTPINRALGGKLNPFHRVLVVVILCVAVFFGVSLCTKGDVEKQRLTWTDLGGHDPGVLRSLVIALGVSFGLFAILAWAMVDGKVSPTTCAAVGAVWTMAMFLLAIARSKTTAAANAGGGTSEPIGFHRDDRFWAGLLCSLAIFMMYYFY